VSQSPGEGWWKASDGWWYPPESKPTAASPTPPPTAPVADQEATPDPTSSTSSPWRAVTTKFWLTTTAAILLLLIGTGTGLILGMTQPASLASDQSSTTTTAPGGTGGTGGTGLSTAPTTTLPADTPTTVVTIPEPPTTLPTTAAPGAGGPAVTPIPPPPAPASGSLVTPAVEQAVTNSTWKAFATAFATDDLATVQSLTTASGYNTVTGGFDCGCEPWPTAFSAVSYSAPPQTTYPISFLAEYTGKNYDGTTLTKEVVFSEQAGGAPWKIAYFGGFTGGLTLLGTNTNDAKAAPAEPSSMAVVANEFVQYIQTLDTTGKETLPAGIVPDQYIYETLTANQYELDKANGWTSTWTHTVVDTSQPFAATALPGSAEACFTLGYKHVVSNADGKPIVQPPDQSLFPPQLAPGSYSSVTQVGSADICFQETPDGKSSMITNWGGAYTESGAPA
jgi:hypothetical protein